MTPIREHADQYLAMRRALGFKLTTFGQRLLSFVAYLEAHDSNVLTADAALAWAMSTPRSTDQVHWSRRLMVVRVFARHLAVLDPATEIPPTDVLPHHYRRVTPHLYSAAEIAALLAAADGLHPPLRALTYRTVISLLAVTGMRVSEACGLNWTDVDLDDGVLIIEDTKYGKHRQVPLHPSTVAALQDYLLERDQLRTTAIKANRATTSAVFVSTRGTRLDHANMPKTFAKLIKTAGITVAAGQRRPRAHDLRHSFTTATLEWYRDGVDVQAQLPVLSTYLGHADPKSTYWYLTASPELLALAADRLEVALRGRP